MPRYRAYYDAYRDFDAPNDDEADEIANRLMPRGCGYADRRDLIQCEESECDQWVEQPCRHEVKRGDADPKDVFYRYCYKHYKDRLDPDDPFSF